MTGHDHLRPVVADAVARYPFVTQDGLFRLENFQAALREVFGLKHTPGRLLCREVLADLTYVKPIRDGYHWLYDETVCVPDRGADSIRDRD